MLHHTLPVVRRVWAALVLAFSLGAAEAGPTGVVYTANERADSISEIQLSTGAVRTVKLEISPHNVQASPDGKWLLATGVSSHAGHHGAGASGQGRLVLLDTADLNAPAISIEAGDHPAHVVTDASGARAFVTDSNANRVRVFDLASRKETGQISTGAYPHGIRLSPDGTTLYVANLRGGTVSVLDVATLRETTRITVGKAPAQVGFSPDGRMAFVSLSGENRLGLIDTATRRLTRKVAVGRTPIQMFATPDSRFVYVANQGSAQQPDDTVSVVDTGRAQSVATIQTGKGAHGVAISTDGAYVFVTNTEAGTLSVIDVRTHQVVTSHGVGAGPNGVSFRAP